MTVLITLTTAGSDTGPFNLYSDIDGFVSAFEVNVPKTSLEAGYTSSLVPDGTFVVRVMSANLLCTNYVDIQLIEVVETCGFTWMLKNLDVDTFRNGDPIPQITNAVDWLAAGAAGQPAWCYYNDDPANGPIYGKLYNWHAAVDPRGIAPFGFHVPNNEEWDAYIACIGGISVAGGKMKEPGTTHWIAPNTASGSEHWMGLPGGNRGWGDGMFDTLGTVGFFWSTTPSNTSPATNAYRYALYNSLAVSKAKPSNIYGFSIRCLKD